MKVVVVHLQMLPPQFHRLQVLTTSILITHLLVFQLTLHTTTAATLNAPIKANCTGQSYAENTPFSTNLNALLSSLISMSSATNSNYSTSTASGNTSDAAYSLYMCEGDLSGSDCHACIKGAATYITTESCPGSRQGVIWYDYCILRYSDYNFFGIPNTNGFNMSNPSEKTSSSAPFNAVAELVKSAPQRPLLFASTAVAGESLYALAQCTVDLTAYNCSKCLTTILDNINACCTQQKGWRYLSDSCWVRYEATPFLKSITGPTEIIRTNCSSSNFTPNTVGIMKPNLDNLLSNLTFKARRTGYYNTNIGNNSNGLYGLALCRGDLIPPNNDCNTCLNEAQGNITTDCGNSTEGIIWYEKCLMRYSDQNFFGTVDFDGQYLCGTEKISQAASDATVKLARGILSTAANSPEMVAAREDTVGSSLSSYVLVQCTRDLSSKDCNSCLEKGLNVISICNQTNGWRYMSGSCTLRYEVSPFYNTSAVSSPVPPPPPPPPALPPEKKKSSNWKIAAIIAPILGAAILGPLLYYLWCRPRRRNERGKALFSDANALPNRDFPLMDLAIIRAATNNFANENKLGEGGFGPVYKGMIHGGMEIAVKRLSAKSKQGATEFKNEVKLIAKLQHRNLVRMLGCCVEGEEKLLIYEFLPNKSLDNFLFDPDKSANLDWNRRFNIIVGIAKGLLYLHEDSLLKVVHRDLKASNVLLDNEMNPKIADFGLSKIFGSDESEANTNRIVGTYGYMAPEYAMDGLFSVKSDVYSFGVLLLEIVSGEKNGRSHYEKFEQTLLRHAWQLWNENKAMELMDSSLGSSYPTNEAMKCIHIGLLCVQENAEERPTMSLVIHMLRDEEMVVSQPIEPPTFIRRRPSTSETSSTTQSVGAHSINELTESILEPR